MPVLLKFIVDLLGHVLVSYAGITKIYCDLLGHVLVSYAGITKIYCGPIGSCVSFCTTVLLRFIMDLLGHVLVFVRRYY